MSNTGIQVQGVEEACQIPEVYVMPPSMTSADLTIEFDLQRRISEAKKIYSASGLFSRTAAIASRLGLLFTALCSS